MGSSYRHAPWTDHARPHDDVRAGILDMGTYAASLAGVFRGRPGISEVYTDAEKFYRATYLTVKMRELVQDVMNVLAGGTGSHVLQLRTPFGGGKTHSLVALLHFARDRAASTAACTELKELADPGAVQIVVLSGEELDPLSPMRATGTETHTLWGEMAAQLGRYSLVAEHDRTGAAPGGDALRQVLGDQPTLILLDEVLVYVEKALALPRGDSTAGRQAMLFIQALTEAISAQPRAAMVYSLQASVGEAVGAEGLLGDLDKLVARVDAKREPVADDEVLRVVQRRLFADLGDVAVHRDVARSYADLLRKQLRAAAETSDARREAEVAADALEQRILAAYPFHPDLLDLMYHRWGSLPSYQRTRGALQFLAAVVHCLWAQGARSPLIGPGDIDFRDEATRGAFFSQVGERERYTAVLSSDITSIRAGAAIVDRHLGADSPTIEQLKVGTRVATAIVLYSFGARDGEERGVLETDLIRSVLVPELDRNVVIAALHDLREEELYLHYTGRRYRFEPTPNLTKLVRDEAYKLESSEVLAEVRAALEDQLRGSRGIALWPADSGGINDERPMFTAAYLHPDWSQDIDPLEKYLEHAGKDSPRKYRNGLALVLPNKAQFDQARHAIRTRLASDSLLRQASKYNFNPEQTEELREKAANARRSASAALASAYDVVAVPTRSRTGDAPYAIERFDLRTMLSAGRALHERVVDALAQSVFGSVTSSKLVALAGLGPEKRIVRCADLVAWFYSYYEFTKLWDKAAIASTIAGAVSSGEIGYVVGLVEADGLVTPRYPEQVRFGERLSADEIDLSEDAAVLSRDYASQCLQGSADRDNDANPALVLDEPVEAAQPQANATSQLPVATPEVTAEIPAARSAEGDSIHVAHVEAVVTEGGLFNLGRALSWFRDQRGARIQVAISIHAEGDFDRVAFRNGAIEPLEEADGNPEVRTE